MEVLLGPLPDDDRDARFDVLLHWRAPQGEAGRVVALERSLSDFQALARTMGAAESDWEALLAADDTRSLLSPAARRQRLRFALERFLTDALGDDSNAPALLRFVAPDVFACASQDEALQEMKALYQREIEEALAGLDSADVSPSGVMTEERSSPSAADRHETILKQERDEWIPAGCSFEHEVVLPAGEGGADAVVVWKFESQREGLKFAVHFLPDDAMRTAIPVDPYAEESISFEEAETAAPWEVVRHWSALEFSEQLTGTPEKCAYGHFSSEKAGVLRLSWENADMNCVKSKQLHFQIGVKKQIDDTSLTNLLETLKSDAAAHIVAQETGNWLQAYFELSTQCRPVSPDELPEWCTHDDDRSERNSLFSDGSDVKNGSTDCSCLHEHGEMQEQAFQIRQLEARVAELTQSWTDTKRELREARDQADIANEIYKANLETITQLEHEAVISKRDREADPANQQKQEAHCIPVSSLADGSQVDSSEHDRVKALCASFQEQCLWRSIETAESEKRNLLLDAKLTAALEENAVLKEQLRVTQRELETTKEEAHKLKAHRAVLVQEVKRLQPFSQVNLTALIQEAQEARMMQRSLQARLDSLQGPRSMDALESRMSDEDDTSSLPEGFVVVSEQSSNEE